MPPHEIPSNVAPQQRTCYFNLTGINSLCVDYYDGQAWRNRWGGHEWEAYRPGGMNHCHPIPLDYTWVKVRNKPEFYHWKQIDHLAPKGLHLLRKCVINFIIWHKRDIIMTASPSRLMLPKWQPILEEKDHEHHLVNNICLRCKKLLGPQPHPWEDESKHHKYLLGYREKPYKTSSNNNNKHKIFMHQKGSQRKQNNVKRCRWLSGPLSGLKP